MTMHGQNCHNLFLFSTVTSTSRDMPSTANAMNVMLSGAQNTDASELSVSAELVWSTAPSTATAT